MNHTTAHHTDPLVKQYKTKPNQMKPNNTTTAADADAFVFYQNNFVPISPFMSVTLMNWVADLGEELVPGRDARHPSAARATGAM
ncbi:hypothetical protein [Lentibacillus cibarius]|uniref:Uncharacterized protein n=1 Tax=Lentibacillus cibarius TaxID=2583219 RepID=A0A5S3QII4_9BACI|nr:hypothetical protein [Lentibacillus cibarius]TMN21740.1 hypothetical protein FFL34_06135 [Lentibacillus cibarius]